MTSDPAAFAPPPFPQPSTYDNALSDRATMLLATDGTEPAVVQRARATAGVRLLRTVPLDSILSEIERQARFDLLWIEADAALDATLVERLRTALPQHAARLVVSTSLDALDAVVASCVPLADATFLVAPDEADAIYAMTGAMDAPLAAVADAVRDDSMARLDALQEEVARIARLLSQMTALQARQLHGGAQAGPNASEVQAASRAYAAPPPVIASEPVFLASPHSARIQQIRSIVRMRRMREQFFPADLFADPAWDMLLDLYGAALERKPVSVSSLCIAAAVPATTALRWIRTMTEAGLLIRTADPLDGRRVFIALGEPARAGMDAYFAAIEAVPAV